MFSFATEELFIRSRLLCLKLELQSSIRDINYMVFIQRCTRRGSLYPFRIMTSLTGSSIMNKSRPGGIKNYHSYPTKLDSLTISRLRVPLGC